jgi:5-hydroxyisourate hydrolase
MIFWLTRKRNLPSEPMPLTTHVLDTVRGTGAAGMEVALRFAGEMVASIVLDAGGRGALLQELQGGTYELLFHAGAYQGGLFYEVIPVRFNVIDPAQNYHIPLILSAFGYSTYRGG